MPETRYNALIGRHNGSDVIKESIGARPWWRVIGDGEATPHDFFWGTCGKEYLSHPLPGKGQLVNMIKGEVAIVKKDLLAVNMRNYARDAKLDVQDVMPQTFVLEERWPGELLAFRSAATAA
jgi:hypothetical protein